MSQPDTEADLSFDNALYQDPITMHPGVSYASDIRLKISKARDVEMKNGRAVENGGLAESANGKRPKSMDDIVFENEDEENKWLKWIETELQKIAGNRTEISLQQFKSALGLKQNFFAERLFNICDSNNSGKTNISNLLSPLVKVTKGTPTQRLKFLFDIYDVNGDGELDIDELMTVLRSCMEESSLKLSDDDLENLTAVLFESADTNQSGSITFDDFRRELERHPGVVENLSLSAVQWLKPKETKKKKPVPCAKYCSKSYMTNNVRKIVFYIVYLLINLGLGGYAAYNYRESNGFTIAARMCGLPLNFNCMLIMVLMLRKSITYLRMTFMNSILPLDHNILFHKRVGLMIGLLSAVHTGAHVGNGILLTKETNYTLAEIVLTDAIPFGTVDGAAMITGWLLDIILVIMIICSMPFVRRKGHFEVFYWTHILYIPFWILLIFHGPNFWKWFIAPGVIFIGEKMSRSKFIKQARYGKTFIEQVNLLPSSVTHLEISRPPNFSYQPGDYIFLQIPAVSKHEWHPFTISSAPELDGRIWLHIRSAGNWTKSLYKYFDQYDPGENVDNEAMVGSTPSNPMSRRMRTTIRRGSLPVGDKTLSRRRMTIRSFGSKGSKGSKSLGKTNPKQEAKEARMTLRNKVVKIECYIDGPYGTATREIFQTEHAVLIGAGIGVTPMASILQSIMYKYKASKRHCPKCSHEWMGEFITDTMATQKVDFIWINRDQKAFEWFLSLLTALEVEQSIGNEDGHAEKLIDMHMYMTAAVKKTDMKGIGLQLALDLMHEKSQRDLITGLKVRTQPGRPDWNQVFKQISSTQKGKVKVFFCGAPLLGKTIKQSCEKFSFDFAKENF